ncbi:uncharacterized protein JCM6883_002558 [Sporobolomyces salmoneus]|uniref:uncharacterized protein n=1 Tax=Sporobolomyces salmoneus TaxID=183962 RepID=UPI00317BF201
MAQEQSLEELIVSQLDSLKLKSDPETVEFVQGLVEEESFLPEDRKSAICGMLEIDEEDEASSSSIDSLLEATQAYQDEVAAQRKAEEEAKAPPKPEDEKTQKVLTPEEEERRKAEFIRQYGQIAEEDEDDGEAIPDKALVDPSKLSKKQRKKAFDGVDLLALPNMNKTHVQKAERDRRNQDAAKSQAKREKDKADLKKQKDDAAKKLADKQKKAQKVERKA